MPFGAHRPRGRFAENHQIIEPGRLGQSYDVRGLVEKATSYGDVSGTTIVNEVQNTFNDFAQLKEQYQEHAGAVNTGTTPKVQYGYADGSTNTIRPTCMTYPNGRVLEYLYDDTAADKLSRIRTLRWDGVNACRYSYLGLGMFIATDYLPPQVKLNYAGGSGANPYTGFDRFGRIVDLLWAKYGASGSSSSSSSSGGPGNDLVHLQYGYDKASNRTYRRDEVARSYGKSFDELYEYDGLNQLKKFHRGSLSEDNRIITSPGLQQAWQFDATGNWSNFTTFDPSDATKTLDQQRLHNRVNEITEIARTVGADWVTPTYDRNGNMTGDETGKVFMYDAWNRLKVVKDAEGATLKTYTYDGLNRRITNTIDSVITNLYYSASWQVLEESINDATKYQYVWSLTYVDAMVLRDRLDVSERLWATQDANWNVMGLVDGNGAVVEKYVYEAFGAVTVLDATWATNGTRQSDVGWQHLFQGLQQDETTGWFEADRRWYSPILGRWVTVDPIKFRGGDSGLYRFVANTPTNSRDPSGLFMASEANQIGNLAAIMQSAEAMVNMDAARLNWPFSSTKFVNLRNFVKRAGGKNEWDIIPGKSAFDSTSQGPNPRYLYTCRCGLIDMRHFYQLMYIATLLGYGNAIKRGVEHEENDEKALDPTSGFAPEDITSNALGAYFGLRLIGKGIPTGDLVVTVTSFLYKLKSTLEHCRPVEWNKLPQREKQAIINYYDVGTREAPGEGVKHKSKVAGNDGVAKSCKPCSLGSTAFPFNVDPDNRARILPPK